MCGLDDGSCGLMTVFGAMFQGDTAQGIRIDL